MYIIYKQRNTNVYIHDKMISRIGSKNIFFTESEKEKNEFV